MSEVFTVSDSFPACHQYVFVMREVLTEKKIRDAKKFPLFGSDTAGRGYRGWNVKILKSLKLEEKLDGQKMLLVLVKLIKSRSVVIIPVIPYLNFQSQLKISQQNHRLADLVKFNAEFQLKKFRRRLQEDKYM